MLVDPKKHKKIQFSHKYLFTLSGSASVKAVHRMLMKLSPGVDFTNILREPFLFESALCSFSLIMLGFGFFGKKNIDPMLMKLTIGINFTNIL
jgi:hypothetical protein